jgi:2-hydroxy-3-keto-5-methylthiopentenyl-1-phosphate phosphatase
VTKYLVAWTEVDTLNLIVEASSKEEAIDKVLNGDYDSEEISSVGISFDGQSIDAEEM